MHVRNSIRDNLVTTLTGLSTTGSNVSSTRVYPFGAEKLPRISIYTKSEDIEYGTLSRPRTLVRTLTAAIEVFVQSNVDDDLDTISSEIETALYADVTRGGYAKDTRVVSFEADFSGDPDKPVGTAVINVQIDYVTIEGSPEAAQ